jgi:hypothetical protein
LIDEIRENLRLFDCARCAHAAWDRDLWAVNRRALDCYHRLGGRTVVDLGLAGSLFQHLTDGWTSRDVLDLVARLERIRSVLDPPRPTTGD